MNAIGRDEVESVRRLLRRFDAVVAEVDSGLRYVWVDNPHPDFDPKAVIGKRDDELIPAAEAEPLMAFKRQAWQRGRTVAKLTFVRSDGHRPYTLFAYPIVDDAGKVEALLTVGFDTPAA